VNGKCVPQIVQVSDEAHDLQVAAGALARLGDRATVHCTPSVPRPRVTGAVGVRSATHADIGKRWDHCCAGDASLVSNSAKRVHCSRMDRPLALNASLSLHSAAVDTYALTDLRCGSA